MSKLHVGLDVSQCSVATRFVLDDGSEPCKGFSFEHNPAGVDKLVAKIRDIKQSGNGRAAVLSEDDTGPVSDFEVEETVESA